VKGRQGYEFGSFESNVFGNGKYIIFFDHIFYGVIITWSKQKPYANSVIGELLLRQKKIEL